MSSINTEQPLNLNEEPIVTSNLVNEPEVISQQEPVVTEEPIAVEEPIVTEEPVVTEETPSTSTEEITLKVDKSTLATLCQNLNSNLLVNIVAYKGVLTKLKDIETDENKKSELEKSISSLGQIQENVSSLMTNVQSNLDVPSDKIINPEAVIEEALKSTSLADQLISAQVTTILASLAAAAILVGGKSRKRKSTKRKRSNGRKHTKKHR